MKETNRVTFYVALDVILDTRFGCLVTHFGDKTLDMTKNYFIREYDRFGTLSTEEFIKLYKKRDKSILKNSIVTNCIDILSDFVKDTNYKNTYSPDIAIPQIVINTYPYDLNETELIAIKIAIRHKIKEDVAIETIKMSPKELTPRHVENNYQLMAMYDYYVWLETQTHLGNVQKYPIRDITLFAPMVYFNDKLNPDEFKRIRKGRTVKDSIEVLASAFINLQLIDIGYFNFLVPSIAKMKENNTKVSSP